MSLLRIMTWAGLCFSVSFGAAFAQVDQESKKGGVNIGRDNSGFINTGEIKFIFESEAALTNDPKAQEVLTSLSEVLSRVAEEGEISVSETAVRVLARDAVKQLANQTLTTDTIEDRQFSVPLGQTKYIAGTTNRISYLARHCGGNTGIAFRFNRDDYCWRGVGGTLEFTSGDSRYELVYGGLDESGNAKFVVNPMD